MGKASITINVGALWNGSSELSKVNTDLRTMAARVAALDKSTTQSLALSGQSWENLGTKIYNVGTRIHGVGDALAPVTTAMTTVGSHCVSQAVTFDTALANLNKTADLTASELQEFGQAALEASKTSPVTAQEILDAEALGAQLGISTDYLQQFADTANGLDIATNMDMETAATQMAQFANITGMADDETSNYGSTIVDLGNHLATTESDLSNMALRLAGTSTAANLSSADILGMAGAMSSLGIKAEAGGSAMTAIISNISSAVAEGGDQVQAYADVCGVSADEFADKWSSSPVEALELMVEGAGRLVDSGEDVSSVLSDLGVEGIRQTDVMRRLIGQSDTLRDAVDRANTAWQENTALSTEVDKRNESLESRFQTLQNKVNAAATEIGVPLANALLDVADDMEPLISGISSACEAFAEMDSDSQKTALALAGIATAAGPVLKVAGTLTQGVGNVVTALGKAQTQAAIFGDAMNTVDGASMRVYASTDSAATKLGLAGNKAAEAAGGADKYVAAWEKMNDAAKTVATSQDKLVTLGDQLGTASDKASAKIKKQMEALREQSDAAAEVYVEQGKLVSAYSGSTSEAEKAAKAAQDATKAYSSGATSCDDLTDALADITGGYQDVVTESGKTASTTSQLASSFKTAASNAKSFGSNVAGMIGQFVQANAAAIAVTALTAAVGHLVAKWQEAKQREELFANATQSVSDVIGGAKGSVSGMGDSLSDLTIDVDGTLESLAKLNQSVGEMFTSYYTSSAQLDQYVATIDELAGKSSLTASEQYRLKEAVDGYNQICGTAYTVTDELNGVLSDASGNQLDLSGTTEENTSKISANTDALNANAAAWKNKALAEAYSSKAAEYLEQEVDASLKLKDAKAKLEAAQAGYNEKEAYFQDLVDQGIISQEEYTTNLVTWGAKVSEAQGEVDKLAASEKTAGDNAKYLQDCASLAAAGLSQDLVETLIGLPEQIQPIGQNLADSLGQGITIGTVSAESAATFLGDGVVGKISGLSEQLQPLGLLVAQRLAAGMQDGSVSIDQATAVMSALATGGLEGLSGEYAALGWELPESLANAISDNASLPEAATSEMQSLVALKLTGGDLDAAAKLCGGYIDQGVADGIKGGSLSQEAASYLGEETITKLRAALGVNSPSVYGIEAGMYVDQGVAQGIAENQQSPLDAVAQMGTRLVEGLASLGTDFLTKGSEAVTNLAAGLGLGIEGVTASSAALGQAASSGVATTATDLGNVGAGASSGFAGGLGSFVSTALSNAASLAANAKSGSNPAISYLNSIGSSAGSAFAAMVGSFAGSASSSGAALASSARSGSSAASGYLSSTGSSAGSAFAGGVASASGSASSSGASLASAASSGSSGWDAYTSGSHLGNQFASGIGSAWGAVKSFASSLVSAAKSVMGFSVPKEGPWAGAEKGGVRSGMHLAQNFATGMMAGVPALEASAMALTAAMTPELPRLASLAAGVPALVGVPAQAVSAGQPVQVTNHNVYINGAQVNNLSAHAQELIAELFGEVGVVAGMGY